MNMIYQLFESALGRVTSNELTIGGRGFDSAGLLCRSKSVLTLTSSGKQQNGLLVINDHLIGSKIYR